MEPEQQIRALERRFKSVIARLPAMVGNEAVNFSLDNFRRQGFLGATFQPWLSRKQGWKKDKRKGRAVLVNTGRLRRSIRVVSSTMSTVTIGTDVPYAKAHNEGARIGVIQSVRGFSKKSGVQVKSHTRRVNVNIPKRQFIGNSPYLDARIKRVVGAAFMKELKTS